MKHAPLIFLVTLILILIVKVIFTNVMGIAGNEVPVTYNRLCEWMQGDFSYDLNAPTDWLIGGCSLLCYVQDKHFELDQSQLQNCTKILNQDQIKCRQTFWGGFVVSETGRVRLNTKLKDGNLSSREQYSYHELYLDFWTSFYYKIWYPHTNDVYPALWHEHLETLCKPRPINCAHHIVYKHEWAETHCKDMTKEEAKRLWEEYVNR